MKTATEDISAAERHCAALAEEQARKAKGRFRSDDAEAIRRLLREVSESRSTIIMLSHQLAEKREIIRRLTT